MQVLESRRLLAGDAPTFTNLGDQTVEVGSPLHLSIDGMDPDGGPLTVTVEVSDPDAVTAEVITGNRSLRLDVASFGTMVFELYEGRAPRPTSRIIELTESGFYDGIIFHRVIDDFVLQAGDPTGTGFSGSALGPFDDQFHPDLQHNTNGVLSFAKSTDDTNNSQFFITERETASTRNLDYNHSVFGQLIEGEDVRNAISEVPVEVPDPGEDPTNRPVTDVVIESATIFEDIENSIVMLRAIDAGVQSDVTITITDAEGNFSAETFTVNTIADQVNAGPYLAEIPKVVLGSVDQSVSLQLESVDIEGDAVQYAGQFVSDSFDSSATLDPETGLFELQPAVGFVGTIDLFVLTRASINPGSHFDSQEFSIQIVDTLTAPGSIDLAAVSDTGIADDDNITSANNLMFEVVGVTPGADIEIVNLINGDVLGQTRATGTSVDVDITVADNFFGEDELDGTLELIARQRTGDLVSETSGSLAVSIDRSSPQLTSSQTPDHIFAGAMLTVPLTAGESGLAWSLVSGPDDLIIDASTGEISWTPPLETRGLHSWTVAFEDAAGNSSEASFSINVTSKYHNLVEAFDVDGLGSVTSLDALLIINAISRNGEEIQLPETDGSDGQTSSLRQDWFYNANNDTAITALDALIVINEVARRQAGGGDPDNEWAAPLTAASAGEVEWRSDEDDDVWFPLF